MEWEKTLVCLKGLGAKP